MELDSLQNSEEEHILQRLEYLYGVLGELRYRKKSTVKAAVEEQLPQQKGRLIVVHQELPKGGTGEVFQNQPLSLSTILKSELKNRRVHWVGIAEAGQKDGHGGKGFEASKERTMVQIGRKTKELFHDGYCKTILWPLFHSLSPTSEYLVKANDSENPNKVNEARMWEAYVTVNQRVADVISAGYKENDMIWIHGYHLMLLPSMLRGVLPDAPIGFFFHLPFPSTEFYRILTHREEILRGLLGSTLVGFQTFDYTRHFLSACTRILGLETSPKGVQNKGHFAAVTICPIGIDPKPIHNVLKVPSVVQQVASLRRQFRDRVVLLGVDSVRVHSGLIHKFLAFEEMLRIKPEWRDKVVLIQICFIKDDGNADLVSRLHRLVARINGRNTTVAGRSGGPVYLIERHASKKGAAIRNQNEKTFALVTENSPYFDDSSILSPYLGSGNSAFFKQNKEFFQNVGPTPTMVNSSKLLRADTDQDVCAIMAVADVLLATATRSGMNITPFHYTVCRTATHSNATLVLSEFVGAAHSLGGGAILVNPWDTTGMADRMMQAITLPLKERKAWHRHVSNHVYKFTASKWMSSLASQLETAHAEKTLQSYLRPLEAPEIVQAFKATKRHLFVMDYEGVLVVGQGFSELVAPSPLMLKTLQSLCANPDNIVVVVSHRQKHSLDQWFSSIPNLVLCAESGAFIRWNVEEDWIATYDDKTASQAQYGQNPVYSEHSVVGDDEMSPKDWRNEILPLFEYYRERTPGSTIEVAETTMAWYYHDADISHGAWQASTLMQSLREFCNRLPILVTSEKFTVRVRLPTVSKATMLMYLLQRVARTFEPVPDFVWIVTSGEDRSDNDMFSLLQPQNAKAKAREPLNERIHYAMNNAIHKSRGESAADKVKEKIRRNTLPFKLPWHLYPSIVEVKVSVAKMYIQAIPDVEHMLREICDLKDEEEVVEVSG